ncbi:kinase-like domain-containing protein [Gigaspora rosea]|uniref:Kinase-like domain-containing protein n=1 Tax=Gigaspora rosea TaxID=44941 RepID=A0A397UJ65_9GLOM|nr:kinase-like domain-containing protein [Gigaspora rosea]
MFIYRTAGLKAARYSTFPIFGNLGCILPRDSVGNGRNGELVWFHAARAATANGKCSNPDHKYNTSPAWCQKCKETKGWTSGDNDIDKCIRELQLEATQYEDVIEWIPFNKLDNIIKIGVGVYKSYKRSRENQFTVALKTLSDLNFLEEFKNHTRCRINGSKLEIYGLTGKEENGKMQYLMVFQYANKGNLREFLKSDFKKFTWEIKLWQLVDASLDLAQIHEEGYTHNDFHSGLGLSKKKNEKTSEIYGVMPYIAPEILLGGEYSPEADIYSFGVNMAEMTNLQRPFEDDEFDTFLALKICDKSLQPEFAIGTPICYIDLAKQCLNSDPKKTTYCKKHFYKSFLLE